MAIEINLSLLSLGYLPCQNDTQTESVASTSQVNTHELPVILFKSKKSPDASNKSLHMTQTEDYIKKEGTEDNTAKTSNSYTIPTVSYNANYKTWSVG